MEKNNRIIIFTTCLTALVYLWLYTDLFIVGETYIFHKATISALMLIGIAGFFIKKPIFMRLGKIGGWYFLVVVIATAIPDEEYRFFNNIELPSMTYIVINLLSSSILAILWLFVFDNLVKTENTEIARLEQF